MENQLDDLLIIKFSPEADGGRSKSGGCQPWDGPAPAPGGQVSSDWSRVITVPRHWPLIGWAITWINWPRITAKTKSMTNHIYIYSAGNLAVLRVLLDAGGDLQAGGKLAFKGRGKWASEAKKRKKLQISQIRFWHHVNCQMLNNFQLFSV